MLLVGMLAGARDPRAIADASIGTWIADRSQAIPQDSMRNISTGLLTLSLCSLMAPACTYRSELNATTDGPSGMGGSAGSDATTTMSGISSTGGSGSSENVRACSSDEDCVRCIYATTPSSTDECQGALGCCGGPVVNKSVCDTNEAAWQAHCANRGYVVPVCPCIIPCTGGNQPTCRSGQCGIWCN
jgi:hypothetical protein